MRVKISRCTVRVLALASLLFLVTASATRAQQQPPELFTYAELIQLYENKVPPEALQVKLDRLLTTPFINNAASARGVQPLLGRTPKLGMDNDRSKE